MKVLVDTSVWSLVLRRNKSADQLLQAVLTELIKDFRVEVIGPVRQEILSGIKDADQFTLLKERLQAFPDLFLTTGDYELAAEYFNTCRNNGIQGSNTDFLICAAAVRNNLQILTTDKDFILFQKHIPIVLFQT